MLQNLQNDAKFQNFQLDNLVDFEKCCKTRIYLQKSVPIQPKTSNILPKFWQNWHGPHGQLHYAKKKAGAKSAENEADAGAAAESTSLTLACK